MAERRTSAGGGFLKSSSSSGALKRSSSVEILTGSTPLNVRIIAKSGNTSEQQLANGIKGPKQGPTVLTQQKSSPTNSVENITKTPPATIQSYSSTPTVNTGIQSPPQTIGSLGSLKSQSSEVLVNLSLENGGSPSGDNTSGAVKTSTPLGGKQPKLNKDDLPSPVVQKKGGTVSKPVIGEGGHIFKVTTEVPEQVVVLRRKKPPLQRGISMEANPLAQRRRKDAVTASPSQGDDEGGGGGEEGGGGGGQSSEPVWQKRLSQLFIPPSERELKKKAEDQVPPITTEEKPPPKTKEPEETSKLLPKFSPRVKPRKRHNSQEENQNVVIFNELNKGGATGVNTSKYGKNNNRSRRRNEEEEEEEEEDDDEEEDEIVIKSSSRINFQDDVFKRKKNEAFDTNRKLSGLDQIESQGRDDDDDSDEFEASSSVDEDDDDDYQFKDGYTSWDDTICSNRSAYFKLYYSQRGVIGGNRSDDTRSKVSRASSHNSLSSLIREKMGGPQLPAAKKSRADIGLMVLVAVLFIIIVIGISLTSYFYSLHLLEMTIFSRLKFFENTRILQIYNQQWEPVTTAYLGSNLPVESTPADCTHYLHYLHKHNQSLPNDSHQEEYEDFVCLDWSSLARLQLRKMHPADDVQCYSVWWVAAKNEFTLRDCLKVGGEHGVWWGGGEMSDGGYPVTNANVPPSHMVTGKLGTNAWGQLLRRTWLTERSSLLTLPDNFQGYVSVNHEGDEEICLESRPHPHLKSPTPTLEYTVCTAPNISILFRFMHQQAINNRKIVVEFAKEHLHLNVDEEETMETNGSTDDDMLFDSSHGISEVFGEEVINRVKERIDQPVWIPWMPPNKPELTQEAVLNYVESIISQDYGNWGHILLPPSWQARPGELTFDPERFPDPTTMVDVLEKKGFRLALSIHPFVSVNAPAFNNGTQEGIWVRQSKSLLPALAQYNDIHPSVVTDFSNPRAKEWFSSRLKVLQDAYKIDRFHLQPADAHALPAFHEYHLPLPGPDSVLVHFMASVSSISPPMSSEGAVSPPLPPTFLTLGSADGFWSGLETLIPRILTLSTLGYPLIDIGVIGGVARAGHVPEYELYVRWIEISTFLPAFQVNVLPRMYGEDVKSIALRYSKIRKDLVLPRLHDKIQDALQYGTPLVVPLALFAPNDSETAHIGDQWIIGKDLLVAPITQKGKRSRNIYLPEGIWKDEIDGHLRRGGRWINDYKVPLTETPHFTLKSIDDFSS